MRWVWRRWSLCRSLPTERKSFKLARAGRPSQKLALPAESCGTLSQQQAEGIVKAAARRLKDKTLAAQAEMAGLNNGASEQISDEQMKVELIGVVREVLPNNSSGQQLGIIAMQADQLRTVREKMNARGQGFDSALGGASKLVSSFGELYTAADTTDNGVAASLETPLFYGPNRVASMQRGSVRLTPL